MVGPAHAKHHSGSRIIFAPLPSDDPKQRQPDIRLAKEKLGWNPVVPLESGLEKTVEYFKTLFETSMQPLTVERLNGLIKPGT